MDRVGVSVNARVWRTVPGGNADQDRFVGISVENVSIPAQMKWMPAFALTVCAIVYVALSVASEYAALIQFAASRAVLAELGTNALSRVNA